MDKLDREDIATIIILACFIAFTTAGAYVLLAITGM